MSVFGRRNSKRSTRQPSAVGRLAQYMTVLKGALILTGSKIRTPGRYRYDDASKDLGDTKEEIHPGV